MKFEGIIWETLPMLVFNKHKKHKWKEINKEWSIIFEKNYKKIYDLCLSFWKFNHRKYYKNYIIYDSGIYNETKKHIIIKRTFYKYFMWLDKKKIKQIVFFGSIKSDYVQIFAKLSFLLDLPFYYYYQSNEHYVDNKTGVVHYITEQSKYLKKAIEKYNCNIKPTHIFFNERRDLKFIETIKSNHNINETCVIDVNNFSDVAANIYLETITEWLIWYDVDYNTKSTIYLVVWLPNTLLALYELFKYAKFYIIVINNNIDDYIDVNRTKTHIIDVSIQKNSRKEIQKIIKKQWKKDDYCFLFT